MSNIMIRRCPTSRTIVARADEAVTALRKEPNVNAWIVDGAPGEFVVEAKGHRIVAKVGDKFLETRDIVAAVQQELVAGSVV